MQDILTVTQLTEQIKGLLESHFELLWVAGEISNLRRPQSGHIYFTLKDDKSQIRAVIFRHPSPVARKSFAMEEGMQIACRARLGVYQPRGEYQLIIDYVEPLGFGALQKAFEQLKAKLAAEGLFAAERKKNIPLIPSRIGIVTSPTGSVIRDIMNITARRFPSANILIAPARVQGAEAPAEIIQAMKDLQSNGSVDVIILARGGGSLEDLAPFNDERVARTIARCRIPLISAIGHETDFTIADFVADLRAPTPSAAAEIVVPVRSELKAQVKDIRSRIINSKRRFLYDLHDRVTDFRKRLRDPGRFVVDSRMTIDDYLARLQTGFVNRNNLQWQQLRHLMTRLQAASPLLSVRTEKAKMEALTDTMAKAWRNYHSRLKNQVSAGMTVLDSLNPLAVLKRGYSITRAIPSGVIVSNAAELQVGADIEVLLAYGKLQATVKKIFRE